jgi:hypothetical protein
MSGDYLYLLALGALIFSLGSLAIIALAHLMRRDGEGER